MSYVNCITVLLCLNLGMFLVGSCCAQESQLSVFESKKMNYKNVVNNDSVGWIAQVRKAIVAGKGRWQTHDRNGNAIVLVWECVDVASSRFNEIIRESADILAQTYTIMELDFARHHPEAIETKMFLKPVAPIFKNGLQAVDWAIAEKTLKDHLRQFFLNTDFACYGTVDDVHIFVSARDVESGAQLGIIQFTVMPQFPYGSVKAAFFAVDCQAQNLGLEKILLSSIFKVVPATERLFLHTRVTNEQAINLYQGLGFKKFVGPLAFWIDLEYMAEEFDSLQDVAHMLK